MQAPEAQVAGGGPVSGPPTALEGQGWRTLDEIARQLSIPRREVEQLIEGWRLAGKPIVAGSRGVKWTDDPTELAAYLEARRRRTAHIHRGTLRLRTTLRRMRERVDLVFWEDVA